MCFGRVIRDIRREDSGKDWSLNEWRSLCERPRGDTLTEVRTVPNTLQSFRSDKV